LYGFEFEGRDLLFETAPGVFSADGADHGTTLLLRTVLPHVKPHQRILDLGTGVGLLGISLATRLTRGEVWMVDVDIRATRLADRNIALNRIENAHVVLGDVTQDLPPKTRFDLVVSNPPTHDGREVLRHFVDQSHHVLRPGGSLWVVVNRLLSIKEMMAQSFGNVSVEERGKGFIVLRSERSRAGMAEN